MIRELNERIRVPTKPSGLSRTKQAFRDECDVNQILAKWQKTGLVTHVASQPPKFGDFDVVPDYQASLNAIIAADSAFMALPSSVRDRFSNDPAKLFTFLQDSANKDEAIKLGLIDPPVVVAEPLAPPQLAGDVKS